MQNKEKMVLLSAVKCMSKSNKNIATALSGQKVVDCPTDTAIPCHVDTNKAISSYTETIGEVNYVASCLSNNKSYFG